MKTQISVYLIVILVVSFFFAGQPLSTQAASYGGRTSTKLSQAEINGLLYMREEEKLAHDVYVVLYQTWGLAIFSNISSSETNHMAAIKRLLDYYAIPDPAQGNEIGFFKNPVLQSLYNSLIIRGKSSLSEALLVGGDIEEIDIRDLENYLDAAKHYNIVNVYNNLLDASTNHLRAFVSNYENTTGYTYVPEYLDLNAYLAIINGTY